MFCVKRFVDLVISLPIASERAVHDDANADVSCCGIRAQSAVMVQDKCARGSDRRLSATGVDEDMEYGCGGVLSNPTGCSKCM